MNRESMYKLSTRFGILLFAVGLPFSHVPAQFGIGLAILGWLGEGLANKNWYIRWHQVLVPLMFYIGWNVLSAMLSERPAHSLAAIVDNEWPVLIMLMMFWTIEDEAFLNKVLLLFLSSASVAMVYSVWQVTGGVELYRHMSLDPMGFGFYRAVGFYSFYLTFAALAMAVFFFSTCHWLEFKRWYFVLLSVFSLLAVMGTFARSMWLSFVVAIPVMAFVQSKRLGAIVSSFLLILLVGGMLAVPAFKYRIASIADPGQNETRLNLWKTALKVSEAHPVFGVGEDNWDLIFDRYRVEGYYDTTVHPHNDYLTVLVSSGVPGLVAFLSMWGIILGAGFKTARKMKAKTLRAIARGGTFSLVGLLMGALFQNYYGSFINCLEWWFVAGLLITAIRLDARGAQETTLA